MQDSSLSQISADDVVAIAEVAKPDVRFDGS